MKNYYYVINGVQGGPVTFEELKTVGITADTLIWSEGMAQWQPAIQVPYVAAIVNAAAKQQQPVMQQPIQQPVQPQQPQCYQAPVNSAPMGGYATASSQNSVAQDAYIVYGLAATIACCILIPVAQLFM